MTTELRTMLLEANPVPHNEYFDGSDELAAIFSTIQRRTSMVKQDERRPDVVPIGTEPPRRRRTALAIAAAAFAVVITVVGGIAVLTDGPNTTVPPVTTEATTTTAAPTSTAEVPETPAPESTTTLPPPIAQAEQEIIDGMIDAFNAEDVETFVSYLQPETEVFMSQASNGSDTVPYSTMGEAVVEHQNWRAMLDQRIVLDAPCGASSPGVITCRGTVEGRLYGNLFPVSVNLRFEFDAEQLRTFVFRENELSSEPNVRAFFDWVGINHPDDLVTIMGARPTQELIELWDLRLTEYEEFLWKSALEADELAVIEGMIGAVNAGDESTFFSYLTPETLVTWETPIAGFTRPYADHGTMVEIDLEFWVARGMRIEVASCERSESTAAVLCSTTMTDRLWGLVLPVDALWAFTVDEGTLTELRWAPNNGRITLNEAGFVSWLDQNHPGDSEVVFPFNGRHTEESLALFDTRLTEYLATLDA